MEICLYSCHLFQVLNGNNGDGGEVQHFLDEPVLTRYIRFEVHTFVGLHPCMGIEVYGCAPAIKPTEASVIRKSSEWIKIEWTQLPSEVDNGKIFGYKICHKLSSSVRCETAHYVGHDTTSYYIKDLIPYTDYNIEISGGTIAGYGPPILLPAKTRESRPSGPPHLVMAQDLTATSVKLLWSPPEESHRNGVITVYSLCYQEASLETSCTTDVQVPGEKLSYDITKGLRPNTEYMFTVAAATVTGLGPRAVLYESTLSSGNFKIYAQLKYTTAAPIALWYDTTLRFRRNEFVFELNVG
ncbi:receptor-type tyrosine- phosphatase S-like [Paramuricea clavata]|uniref:Receptor-type tyrosine- phosphatase S-like n=1 Tax=Paramuricea clavata TaxID=317549 RepID=A0A6S7GWR5_PARCT|nr:receptor-type tyrosine- phosphatase S-like [Paramuricea clavata]